MSLVQLADHSARAEVDCLGAELRGWSVGEVPLIWTPDDAIWPDTAPILFPIVGWTRGGRIRIDGADYPLGVHGFARHLTFEIAEQASQSVSLATRSTDATRAAYPFDWTLEVTHALEGPRLSTTLTIANEGERPMPYACGLHPGFRWPFAGGAPDDYTIVFEEREAANVPSISPEGLFTRQTWRLPMDGRRLPLSVALMEHEALCFLDARSRSLRFAHPSGAAIEAVFDDFPHIALWSRPAGHFLSIEAWTGHGDFVDADGDIANKPSMRVLAPGAAASHTATFAFAGPHRRSAS